MSKIQKVFDILLDLDILSRQEGVEKYISIIELNEEKYSATLTANQEGIDLVCEALNNLKINYTIVKTDWWEEDKLGNFKLLDIDI